MNEMYQPLQAAMNAVLEREFTACMFDYDGTLIERGYRMPLPEYMPQVLQETSRKAYMAICTARPFPAAFKHAHDILGEHFDDLKRRWVWICENGGAGYAYDADAGEFKEFYRVEWPSHIMPYLQFQDIAREAYRDHVHEIEFAQSVAIMRPKNLPTLSVKDIAYNCETLEQIGIDLLKRHHLEDDVRLGNSSLGIIFYGANADKDRGIYEFGKYLQRQVPTLSEPFRDIICFGDRPVRYGNDEFFLSGRYGTPVNVGDVVIPRSDLLSVIDEHGERLIGPRATSYLLERLHFQIM